MDLTVHSPLIPLSTYINSLLPMARRFKSTLTWCEGLHLFPHALGLPSSSQPPSIPCLESVCRCFWSLSVYSHLLWHVVSIARIEFCSDFRLNPPGWRPMSPFPVSGNPDLFSPLQSCLPLSTLLPQDTVNSLWAWLVFRGPLKL